jgi:hypothetical protein
MLIFLYSNHNIRVLEVVNPTFDLRSRAPVISEQQYLYLF